MVLGVAKLYLAKVRTIGTYQEFDDGGKIISSKPVTVYFCIGEKFKKDQIIEISIPDKKYSTLHAHVMVKPERLLKIILNGKEAVRNA